ncbi:MAG: DUF86 domain-containing protein [Candidatus Thermoplasmatota archaeon]|nr:DUF86 domain-containing protein [Candidatus Thermoplasmatota archaeon]
MIRLASVISRIEKHKRKAKELSKQDLSNYLVFSALAMECFQAVNAAIDSGGLIVSEKRLGYPPKYREIFEFLYNEKIIGNKTLENIKRLIFLKNLISHKYYTITERELKEMANLLDCLDELMKKAKGFR